MKNTHFGMFRVSGDLLESPDFPDILAKMRFVPTRVEMLYEPPTTFEYVGLSPLFRQVAVGEKMPEYAIKIKTKAGVVTSVSAEILEG